MTRPAIPPTKSVQLDQESLKALQLLVGRPVLELFTPLLNVCRLWYAAPSVSIPWREQFLVVESEWQETTKEASNYYIMRVSLADHPKDVPMAQQGGRRIIGHPVSTVEIGEPKSPVGSIMVLENDAFDSEELVRYDAGLVFNFEDGRSFALATRQSILGGLECTTDRHAITELVAARSIRTVLD